MSIPPCDSSSLPPPSLEAARVPQPHFAAPAPAEDAPPPPILNPLEPLPVTETLDDWMDILRDAMTYPPRKDGWFILLPGAIMGVVLTITFGYGLLLGTAYFAAYYLSVVQSTIVGRDQPPDWPSITNLSEDLWQPLGAVAMASLVSFAPRLIYIILVPKSAQATMVTLLLEGFGRMYFPMALLSYVMQEDSGSILPHRVLPAMVRTWRGYLIVTGAMLGMGLVSDGLLALSSWVPLLGSVFACLVTLWFLMVHGRLLGLFYLKYQQRLGW